LDAPLGFPLPSVQPRIGSHVTARALSHISLGWGSLSAVPYMRGFKYRCPKTGSLVQGWFADDLVDGDANTYQQVTCTTCGRTHMVNPKTGRVLGAPIE
jgi:predicted nucleic-acid-binding Zn-ribbon protein